MTFWQLFLSSGICSSLKNFKRLPLDHKETPQSPGKNIWEFFAFTDQKMEGLSPAAGQVRRAALPFASWVQNKASAHHTIGQTISTLQLNTAHTVPFFWDELHEGELTLPSLEALKPQEPWGTHAKLALLWGRGQTRGPPVLPASPYRSTIASQHGLLYA